MPVYQSPDKRGESASPPSHAFAQMPMRSTKMPPGKLEGDEPLDGSLPENPSANEILSATSLSERVQKDVEVRDRAELMERIKRGEHAKWVPSKALEEDLTRTQRPEEMHLLSTITHSKLLPPVELTSISEQPSDIDQTTHRSSTPELASPAEIERPRSALHSGDFTASNGRPRAHTNFSLPQRQDSAPSRGSISTSPPTPWLRMTSPDARPFLVQTSYLTASSPIPVAPRTTQSRPSSLYSISSSFVLKTPTSPLVQSSNNEDLEFSPLKLSSSPSKSNRRHTLPPNVMDAYRNISSDHVLNHASAARFPASLRKEGTFPYQTHQPRRSLTSAQFIPHQGSASPPTPAFLRSRRMSLSGEASPLQHASMVGSYEESILRGRMSTGPSKPLDFTAQIGALGKGNCKPKYPAHVTVPFPAVYYNYSNSNSRTGLNVDTEPSPYVGHIDIEHLLPPEPKKERRRKHIDNADASEASTMEDAPANRHHVCSATNLAIRKREKKKRRSESPKAPPGGSYRIPQTGQLQILVKNPNKTAVKLFLVPYNLDDMESGTKTFIRQRCFSAGPIMENPVSSSSGAIGPMASAPLFNDPKGKPTLRYLIHLNICCPSKRRYYLYQHMRVVFANRVPDNKENLRTEISFPEPRYSTYKPLRDSSLSMSTGAKQGVDTAQRRRSYGFGSTYNAPSFGGLDNSTDADYNSNGIMFPHSIGSGGPGTVTPPVPPIPYHLSRSRHEIDRPFPLRDPDNDVEAMDLDTSSSRPTTSSEIRPPLSDKASRSNNFTVLTNSTFRSTNSSSQGSSSGCVGAGSTSEEYSKLKQGEAGYGGFFGRAGSPEPGDGLLARRLRGFSVDPERSGVKKDREC
ncbi:hypothetical protein MMC25_003177 [Agyrium rufum]|nr:hypothetical protein [Agyrium rufum]